MMCSVECSIGRLFEAGDDADESDVFIRCKIAKIHRGLCLKMFRKVIYRNYGRRFKSS